jgi:hypothetical protein
VKTINDRALPKLLPGIAAGDYQSTDTIGNLQLSAWSAQF